MPNNDQPQSSVVKKNAPEMHRSENSNNRAGASKADSRYWLQGKRLCLHDSANYSIQLQNRGRRAWFPLGTPNKKSAAAKASEIYSYLQAHGWEAALKRYKPEGLANADVKATTIGALIEAATRISSARRPTLEGYAKALRLIVSEIKGVKSDGKFDAYQGGLQKWRAKVDAISLAAITPAEILAWKNKRLRDAEGDPLAKRRAIITVNSLMRNAKSLFGKKLLPFIEQTIPLPRPLPFDGVSLEKEPSLRYISKIDPYAILARAKEELAKTEPEAFKVMILALVCGLRRAEIDHLLWRVFDFPNSTLSIETTEHHALKSDDSAGKIDLDADTLALFRGYRSKNPTALFVIKSPLKPAPKAKVGRYRCKPVFDTLIAWLRKNGVDGHKPLHTLRKEIGSIIASEHGIFEASRYLRHADIHITSAFYADKKKTITPKTFAGLLGNPVVLTHGPSTKSPKKRGRSMEPTSDK
jgi:integrase